MAPLPLDPTSAGPPRAVGGSGAGGGALASGEQAKKLVADMTRSLERGEGYRFGESAIVSRRLHLVSSARPGELDVVTDADAGKIFYHRSYEGQVLHIDIFHEVGEVEHRAVARAIAGWVTGSTRGGRVPPSGASETTAVRLSSRRLADYIDLQTATGGGRITGSLAYGQGETLRRAHLTHVHLAALITTRDYPVVPRLVIAVEEAIHRQGLEIRRVERINHVRGAEGGGSLDLSDYASPSDSLLKETRHDWSTPDGGPTATRPSYLRGILDLADEFGGLGELQEMLDTLSERPTWSDLHRKLRNRVPLNQVLSRLEEEGLLESERGVYSLSRNGHTLHDYVRSHRRDIELRFKVTLRKLPFSGRPARRPAAPTTAVRTRGRGVMSYRRVKPAEADGWVGSLAVPETMVSSLTRRLGGPALKNLPPNLRPGADGWLLRSDLMVHARRGLAPLDICLVIDASASMAGMRMRAAKYLAQHLLLSTRDRLAVVVFQEREAGLYVPFSRNYDQVEQGLRRIRPLGLTPLAEGLIEAAAYVRKERRHDPLLLLITDGIPTVPRWTMNPVADAQTAAAKLARERVRFSCIGLEPNRGFLKDLAAAAHGTLHIVDELEHTLLSEIAHTERRRLRL